MRDFRAAWGNLKEGEVNREMFERVKYEFIFYGFQHVLSAWPDDQPKVH
jgi:hypothetical protein